MTSAAVENCPLVAEREPAFTSLGAIDRIGDDFCQFPQALQYIDQGKITKKCMKSMNSVI